MAAATVASDSAANAASPTADKKKAGVEKKEPDSEEKQVKYILYFFTMLLVNKGN